MPRREAPNSMTPRQRPHFCGRRRQHQPQKPDRLPSLPPAQSPTALRLPSSKRAIFTAGRPPEMR